MSLTRHFAFILFAVAIFVLPYTALAATSADGTTCSFVLNGTCYVTTDSGTTNKGPAIEPSIPGFDANNIDSSKLAGCQIRGNIPNIGHMNTIGGPYVPVSDLAVTRNTGYLVYKECVLDALSAKMKEAATAKIAQDTLKLINEGDNGNPLFVDNLDKYRAKIANQVVTEYLKDYNTGSICEPFREEVRTTVVKAYLAESSGKYESFSCSFKTDEDKGHQEAFLSADRSKGTNWQTWWSFSQNPSNSPRFAYAHAKQELDARIAQVQTDEITKLNWGNGVLSREIEVLVPQEAGADKIEKKIVTPGILIAGAMLQAAGSGFEQLKAAESMDQIIDAGYASLSAQIISNPSGLVGITKPQTSSSGQTGGSGSGNTSGLSYLDQILQTILGLIQKGVQSSGGTPSTGGTDGTQASILATLNASLGGEQEFLSYREQVKTYLDVQAQNFVTTQNACWVTLAAAVTIKANGNPFTVATSSSYSTTAINDVVTPFRTVINKDIGIATTSIATLKLLVATVASSTNTTVNQTALSSLNDMRTQKLVHTAGEIAIAKNNITDIQGAVSARVSATMTAWKEGNGWCNASSTAVVQSWFDTWRVR